jgi:hypothetical protein
MASTPLGVRRSDRIPAQPHRLADEQATHRYHAQELADLRRATEQSLAPDVSDESDEETPPDVDCSSSEEEEEEKENDKPHAPWVEQTRDIPRPPCSEQPASNLPRHREHTEFGYLRVKDAPSCMNAHARIPLAAALEAVCSVACVSSHRALPNCR